MRGSNAYYFVIDSSPSDARSVRVMRVCHNSNFSALYELTLTCGIGPNSNSRISGLSVAENFAGTTGASVIFSRSQQQSSQRNFMCLFNLNEIDNILQGKFDSCTANAGEQIDLAWRSLMAFCSNFLVSNRHVLKMHLDEFINFLDNSRYLSVQYFKYCS